MLVVKGWRLPQSTRSWLRIIALITRDHNPSGIVGLLESSPNIETLFIHICHMFFGSEVSSIIMILGTNVCSCIFCYKMCMLAWWENNQDTHFRSLMRQKKKNKVHDNVNSVVHLIYAIVNVTRTFI